MDLTTLEEYIYNTIDEESLLRDTLWEEWRKRNRDEDFDIDSVLAYLEKEIKEKFLSSPKELYGTNYAGIYEQLMLEAPIKWNLIAEKYYSLLLTVGEEDFQ